MFNFMVVRKHHSILKQLIVQNKMVEILREVEKEYGSSYYTDKYIDAERKLAKLDADLSYITGKMQDLGINS